MGVALTQQLSGVGHGGVQLHFHAQLLQQSSVLGDGFVADTETGDDVLHNAAQSVALLEDGGLRASLGQEVGRSHTSGAAAYDGNVLAAGSASLQASQEGVVAALGSSQLGSADLYALLVEVTGALGHAAVAADGAGDEGQGVLLADNLQSLHQLALAHQLNVGGDILMDGAASLFTGSHEAVDQGNVLLHLAAGQGLDGLHMVSVGLDGIHQSAQLLHIHTGEGLVVHGNQLVGHGTQAVVSAGLQQGGGQGDGPDAGIEDAVDVEVVSAAGVGYPQLAAELLLHLLSQADGQRIQALAAHVHLLAGQLAGSDGHGEGVGQLDAEFHVVGSGQIQQTVEHGDGVLKLQVALEVMVVEYDVIVAHVVQGLAGELVAQQSGVALDVGIQLLLVDEVGSDALDLIRGAAVQGGQGDGGADMGIDAIDVGGIDAVQAVQVGLGPFHALSPYLAGGGILHALDVGVHLFALDTGQVVANAHVEYEAVLAAQAVHAADQLQSEPGLYILFKSLGNAQLGAPFHVVALVLCLDAGLGDGQILTVDDLNGLDLEEAAAAGVCGDQVLSQLGVRTGSGAEGGLDLLGEDGQSLAGGVLVDVANAEDGALLGVLGEDPIHQFSKRNGAHDVAHNDSPFSLKRSSPALKGGHRFPCCFEPARRLFYTAWGTKSPPGPAGCKPGSLCL